MANTEELLAQARKNVGIGKTEKTIFDTIPSVGASDFGFESAVPEVTAQQQPVGGGKGVGFEDISRAIIEGTKEKVGAVKTGFQEDPIAALSGLATGAQRGATFGLANEPKRDPFTEIEDTFSTSGEGAFAPSATAITGDVRKPKQMSPEERARIEKSLEVQALTDPVGEFGGKLGTGIALSAIVPGSGIAPLIAKETVAELPFTLDVLAKKGSRAAVDDLILSSAINLATLGITKGAKPLAKMIKGKYVGLVDEQAETIAKEALARAKELPTPKQISQAVEGGTEAVGIDILANVAPPKNLRERFLGRISEADRSILSEPLRPQDTPIAEYAKIARGAVQNARNLTPMDVAGRRAVEAVNKVAEKKSSWGAVKGAIIDEFGANPIKIADVKDTFLKDASQIMGADFDDAGKIIGISKNPSQNAILEKAFNLLEDARSVTSVRQADNLKSALRDLIASAKSRQIAPNVAQSEAVIKNARKALDNRLKALLPDEFATANKEFARLKELQDNLNRRLGEVVDRETKQARMGASLLKSSIQSNADRGSKAMFRQILEETGIDLIKEAKFAEIAMRGVGDVRITSLLQEIGDVGGLKGKIISGVVNKGKGVVQGDPLDEIINFFNKQQQKGAKKGLLNLGEGGFVDFGALAGTAGALGTGGLLAEKALTKEDPKDAAIERRLR